MRRLGIATAALITTALALLAPAAANAEEKVLTFYSPKLESEPYVHKTQTVPLRVAEGEAPKEPGYILGFKEQVLVDSKDPNAKPLPIGKMMIHHFLYFAPGRIDQAPGSCWGNSGFIGGRGEEHPSGDFTDRSSQAGRDRYGIANMRPDGTAPDWILTAMVMNHYQKAKSFYVRTRVWYTTEKREPLMPLVVGNCSQLANG